MNTEDAIFAGAVDEIMEKKKISPNTLKKFIFFSWKRRGFRYNRYCWILFNIRLYDKFF